MNQPIFIITVFFMAIVLVTTPLLVLWLVWGREKYAVGGRSGQIFPDRMLKPSTVIFLAALLFIAIMELLRV